MTGVPTKLHVEYRTGSPKSLKLLEVNARFMRHETFQALVANLRRDGALTQPPLVYRHAGRDGEEPAGTEEVLSGNHRVKASIEAGLEEIGWLEISEPLTRQQRVAIQLSHNAIVGEDDPAVLKQLYESLTDVDWRSYAGLDDATLDLLAQVDIGSLSEANLDFQTVSMTFLPHEVDDMNALWDEIKGQTAGHKHWLAARADLDGALQALDRASTAYGVQNIATALRFVLDVFNANVLDLQEGWWDEEKATIRHTGVVPLESLFGTTSIAAGAAGTVKAAIDRLVSSGDVDKDRPWHALELIAADFLAGPG